MSTNSSVSHKRIWSITGPMILANLSTPLLGMVDTAVVGHLSSAIYLGAVAIGTMIFSFLFWGFGFLRMVTTGLTSQATTAADAEEILMQSTILAIIISFALLLLQMPISWVAFQLFDTSQAVLTEAHVYFNTRIWSAPATLLNYVVMGWLIGRESSREALLIVLSINFTNIILDLILVNQFGMKTEGVALASVIAEYAGLIIGVCLLIRKGIHFPHQTLKTEVIKLYQNRLSLALHANFMLRTLCLIFSFAFFTHQGAKHGEIILAANMVLLNFITLMAYVLDAFANATEVLAGRAISLRDKQLLKSVVLKTGAWSLAGASMFCLCYLFFGENIIAVLTNISTVSNTAQTYLFWLIIAPLIGVWSYLFDGLFVGATLGKEMRNTMMFSVFFAYLPAWYLLQDWGNHGLWAALLIFLAARGISQACYLRRIFKLSDVNA